MITQFRRYTAYCDVPCPNHVIKLTVAVHDQLVDDVQLTGYLSRRLLQISACRQEFLIQGYFCSPFHLPAAVLSSVAYMLYASGEKDDILSHITWSWYASI
jgi:hypothetical protein